MAALTPARLARLAVLLVRCTHPSASFAITAGVALLGLSAGVGWRTLILVPAVLLGQFSLGWTNDYLDRDRDRLGMRTEKPIAAGLIDPVLVVIAAIAGTVAALLLTFPLGVLPLVVHAAGLLLGQVHNFGTRRFVISVVPFVFGFALLPIFVAAAASPPHLPARWLIVAAGLIGAGAHFSNALRDYESDLVVGMGGLPQAVGPRVSAILAGALMLAAAGTVALYGGGRVALVSPTGALGVAAALLACGIAATGLAGRRALAYRLTLAAGLVAVVALLLGGSAGFR